MKRLLFLSLVLLALGAAACTQSKPNVPTATLVPLNQTPVLPVAVTETPGAGQPTAEPGMGGTPGAGGETPVAPAETPGTGEPTLLPTPTTGVIIAPPPADTPVPSTSGGGGGAGPSSGGGSSAGGCSNPYTVQRGDWLYAIARKCGVSAQALIAANGGRTTVFPGQRLVLPGGGAPPPVGPGGPTGGRTYVVRPGDNLFRIALRFGTTVPALMQLNGLSSSNVYAGQVLRVP